MYELNRGAKPYGTVNKLRYAVGIFKALNNGKAIYSCYRLKGFGLRTVIASIAAHRAGCMANRAITHHSLASMDL
jgi:hypothetical protein